MIFDLLASMVRHIREIGVQLKAIDLFDLIASRVNDNIRLQRLVPYVLHPSSHPSSPKSIFVSSFCDHRIVVVGKEIFFENRSRLFPRLVVG